MREKKENDREARLVLAPVCMERRFVFRDRAARTTMQTEYLPPESDRVGPPFGGGGAGVADATK